MKKSILVVGGTRGIGRACVDKLARADNDIYIVSRSASQSAFEQYEASAVSYFDADVCNDDLDLSFLPESLDGLVYCPGSINLKPLRNLSIDDFRNDYNINVLGFIRVLEHCLPALKQSINASVVTFSTVAASQGMNFHSSISASKGAMEALIRSLAAEFAGVGMRFNSIALSLVDTPLASKLIQSEQKRNQIAARHPMQKIGDPTEVAVLVEYLLRDESSWMTGQVIGLDGGLSVVKSMT